ncbi:MAG TPA: hypothetical protein VNT30_11130 [Stellaceae bacterium]|nr:hypothetical protein [Stellaceae bacterium]
MSEPSLELIQSMLQRLLDGQRTLQEDVTDLKRRMTSLEQVVSLIHGDFAGQSARIDRIEDRLHRIERRLDLAPA